MSASIGVAAGAVLGSLAAGIARSFKDTKLSEVALEELNSSDHPIGLSDGGSGSLLRFQYFPESISDSKQVNWNPIAIPGASLPLYQWINSGERVLSFTAVFTTDTDLASRSNSVATSLQLRGIQDRNLDLRTAILWLRRFLMPSYDPVGSQLGQLTRAPRKLRLHMPNSGIGAAHGAFSAPHTTAHSITAIMTQCEVEWVQFFPSGAPRIATAQVAFAQVAQFQGAVSFPGVTSRETGAVYNPIAGTSPDKLFQYNLFARTPESK